MLSLVAKLCPTLVTPWTVACQTLLSTEFPRQEYWNGLPFPSPGDLPDPGIKSGSPALQADALLSEPPGKIPPASKPLPRDVAYRRTISPSPGSKLSPISLSFHLSPVPRNTPRYNKKKKKKEKIALHRSTLPKAGETQIQKITSVSSCSYSVMSNSLWPHGLQHTRLPCPLPTPGACSNSCPLSRWCHSTISSSVVPFSSCLQSFPASGSFLVSQFFISGDQSIGVSASASVLPMKTQDWFLLGWTGWISLQSRGLSRVFSWTTVQKHQFFGAQLSL